MIVVQHSKYSCIFTVLKIKDMKIENELKELTREENDNVEIGTLVMSEDDYIIYIESSDNKNKYDSIKNKADLSICEIAHQLGATHFFTSGGMTSYYKLD